VDNVQRLGGSEGIAAVRCSFVGDRFFIKDLRFLRLADLSPFCQEAQVIHRRGKLMTGCRRLS